MFWSNWMNGFSGMNIFTHFYFSLYNVIDTNLDTIFYALLSNDSVCDPQFKNKLVRRAS